jgi:hypothetical protein
MKTIVAELLLLPVLVVSAYCVLIMYGFLRPMGYSDRSFIAQYGELIVPFLIALVIVAQMLILLWEWKPEMKRRWAMLLTVLFVAYGLWSAGSSLEVSSYIFGIYLVVLASWLLGFRQFELPSPNVTRSDPYGANS